jgi:hypothetical protein
MYQIIKFNNNQICIFNKFNNAWIPFSEDNKDYQEYLKWVSEGNIAEEYNPGGIQ